ncbi:MAG: DUF4390 domain-containing protein [Thermodesulfobacteriota bacterium]
MPVARPFQIFFFCLFLITALPFTAMAGNAAMSDTSVAADQDFLMLRTAVTGAFNEKMEAAIKGGVPVTFTFFARVSKTRRLWFDRDIAEHRVTHMIKYDNLKEEFTVRRSWEGEKTLVTKSLDQARQAMSRIEGFPLCRLNDLEKGTRYRIGVKAELDKMTLPLYLHYVLFFVSLWDVETDWQYIDFTY